jgi:hypothetical protein
LGGALVSVQPLNFFGEPETGDGLVPWTISGANPFCPAGYHPATAWEAMVLDIMSWPDRPVPEAAWVVGSFPNEEFHLRSLVNGQDSLVCPAGEYLIKYPSAGFAYGLGEIKDFTGGLHCASGSEVHPLLCARNR